MFLTEYENLPILRKKFTDPIQETFDNLVNQFFLSETKDSAKSKFTYPKTDMYIDNNLFIIEMSVPGVTKENISVEIDKKSNVLSVKGNMSDEYKSNTAYFYVKEVKRSDFERNIKLPSSIKQEDYSIQLNNGMLTIKFKLKEEVLNKKPEIDHNKVKLAIK